MKQMLNCITLFLIGTILSFTVLTLVNHGSAGEFSPFRYMMF